ncbi:MAG: LysM peptidoglycan-binding domain-containing protein [Chloroflexi bacterium]|nr:MAG: LysM peptidoglycan-binding domain-containing protein [Chloroflexota bacterium]
MAEKRLVLHVRFFITLSIVLLLFISASAQADDELTHVVQPGENLFRIALRYGVNMDELAAYNNIANTWQIYSGQVLKIPGIDAPTDAEIVENPLVAGTPITHVVQRGETLGVIAQQYGTTIEQILQANQIDNPNRILVGQTLQIWSTESAALEMEVAAESTTPTAAPTIEHVVQRGETLSDIARQYGVDWPTLAQVNQLSSPNQIYAGQTLLIPQSDGMPDDFGILEVPQTYSDPGATITTGKQIVVDLSDSTIYAYENGQLIRSAIVSTGLPATPTVVGDYNIYLKLDAQTMSGPGYYLPDVPWVMYFYQGYAVHGTYWHNNFGQPMSHGCVNLPIDESAWFYNWAPLGTPVHVQY